MDEKRGPGGYASAQLAKAFVTALTHEDADVRRLAERRVRRWRRVLDGIADGTLSIGERAPVEGLPVWATPEVVRGGFATGDAVAGGPLAAYEVEAARRAGVPAERQALFGHYLSDAGLAELGGLLDSGRYEVQVPEEAVLLVVAWLVRAGDIAGALGLLEAVEPYAGRLRFAPRPGGAPVPGPGLVCRETVGQVRAAMAGRRSDRRIEAMNEALSVWNPFADELLELWLAEEDSAAWRGRAAELLARYRDLASVHTLCAKHRKPKANITILRAALEDVVEGGGIDARRRGLLRSAVNAMVAKRGRPGSQQLAALRKQQREIAERPTHHALVQILLSRLSGFPQDVGVDAVEPLVQPVTGEEEDVTGVPAGSEIPVRLRRIAELALCAPPGTLIERGVVPSAEVLAHLVPQIVASTVAETYADEPLRALMAAHYRAFRNRRSLLLQNLDHQVRIEELPWVRAVETHRRAVNGTAHAALREVAELALQGFPATILPNPLVRELDALAWRAGLDVPFVEELAADIFTGTFSAKFLRAAKLAADLLTGSLYARYYGVDYAAIGRIDDAQRRRWLRASSSEGFSELCHALAGVEPGSRSAAAGGAVIEQAQIITTHNLAALAGPVGARPAPGWEDLARRSFAAVCRLLGHVPHDPRPLRTVKDAAYAWRQTLFFLTMAGTTRTGWLHEEAARRAGHVQERLAPVLAGLDEVAAGGAVTRGRRFTGWAVGGHWMLDAGRSLP